MQNKGAIKFFAIAFVVVCLFHLSFTYFTGKIEKDAEAYSKHELVVNEAKKLANGDPVKEALLFNSLRKERETYYLDSMSNVVVYNLMLRKYTYRECKERELNLGLDLKGGMNVTLDISVVDIVRALSHYSKDPVFNKAIERAQEMQKEGDDDFITLFANAVKEVDPNVRLSKFFNTYELRTRINLNTSDEEVLEVIRKEAEGAIARSFEILRTRIDKFGVTQPNIQMSQTTGRILVELPGVKDPTRVRKLLQGTAKLEFWETYDNKEVHKFIGDANDKIKSLVGSTDRIEESEVASEEEVGDVVAEETENEVEAETEVVVEDTTELSVIEEMGDSAIGPGASPESSESREMWEKENPLFAYLRPALFQGEGGQLYPSDGPVVGYAAIMDTAKINKWFRMKKVKSVFPRKLRLLWTVKPYEKNSDVLQLIAIKVTGQDGQEAALGGDVVIDARQDISSDGSNEVTMQMNIEGAKKWKRLTAKNINKHIAIVLDDYVYSFPVVRSEIPNGRSSISGGFTLEEAMDLANILKAGKLPAPARIVEEAVVGPSLGHEAIRAGVVSFLLAFVLVLVYMVLYYNLAGAIADIVLFGNLFFLFGVLASVQAVLTLPGIAGIVLTIGMAVDANVIIYERIKEELQAGKGIRLAITDGYKNAYSAIIDGNVTTLLTGIVLFVFGSGPVQGFATTLIIGIVTSLFSALFLSRIMFLYLLKMNKKITFDNKYTKGVLSNVNIDFLGKRKIAYIVSSIVIIIGLVSLMTRGLNQGVDFSGGRTYVVRFDENVKTNEIRSSLSDVFGSSEVKTFGPENQVKVTTKYMIDEKGVEVDSIIESKLYEGLKQFYNTPISKEEFLSDADDKLVGKFSSQMVGPTIADDIKNKSMMAVVIALIVIFIYIALRFKRWQFGVSGVITLAHDSIITISMYSIFYGLLPFNLEIDQAFIAAILTIIGYSINDTVIIFDRIREHTTLYPKRKFEENINGAVNSTLGRTFMTSGTTLLVLLMIFIFGGEIIRGFSFAMIIGVLVGTYSSLFTSTPIAYDFIMIGEKKKNLLEKTTGKSKNKRR